MRLLLGVGVPALVALMALNLVIPEMQQYRQLSKQEEQRVAAKRVKRAANACASKVTYDRIKNLAFDEAVKVRRADARNLHKLAAFSVIRMESPIVKSRDESLDVTVCSGRFVLEIPPGAERGFNGERQLRADVEYTAQSAADGSGLIYQLAGADPIIYKLAAFDLKGHKFTPRAESLLLAEASKAPPVASPQSPGVTAAPAPVPVAAPQQVAAAHVPAPAVPAVAPSKADGSKRLASPAPARLRAAKAPVRPATKDPPTARLASAKPGRSEARRKVERSRQAGAAKPSTKPVRLARVEKEPRHRATSSVRKTRVSPTQSTGRVARASQVLPASAGSAAKKAVRQAVAQSVAKRGERALLRKLGGTTRVAYRPAAEAKKATRPAQSRPAKPIAPDPKTRPVQIAQAGPKRSIAPANSKIANLSAVIRSLSDEPPPRPKPTAKPQPIQAAAAVAPKSRPGTPRPLQYARVETSRIVTVPRTARTAEATPVPKPLPPAPKQAPAIKPAPVQVTAPVRRQHQAAAPIQASRCGYARSRSEEMVCMNGRLASLDRSVARMYQAALSESGGRAQYDLRRTQDWFLSYVNRCRNEACLADAFQGRMEEIRDIVVGRWRG